MAEDQSKNNAPQAGGVEQPAGTEAQGGSEIPAVAESGAKKTVVLVIAGLFIAYIGYNMFFSGPENPATQPDAGPKVGTVAPDTGASSGQTSADVSAPPPMEAPPPPPSALTPPLPPVPPPAFRGSPGAPGAAGSPSSRLTTVQSAQVDEKIAARIKSPISVIGGTSGGGAAPAQPPAASGGGSGGAATVGPRQQYASLSPTGATSVTVTEVGDPHRMIVQGKMIDAVLETAINTDLPGVLRAVVSRDIYAEAGRDVLVPKGSRLIGSYNTDIKRGQVRIYIIWNRITLPDGLDVDLKSPTTSQLGQSGLDGVVDNKYLEIFSNSLLLSTVSVSFAAAADALTGSDSQVSQGETGSGDSTTSGNVTDIAVLDAVQNFGDTVQGVIGELINIAPTITVEQGTKIKVFANRDIKFPAEISSDIQVIR